MIGARWISRVAACVGLVGLVFAWPAAAFADQVGGQGSGDTVYLRGENKIKSQEKIPPHQEKKKSTNHPPKSITPKRVFSPRFANFADGWSGDLAPTLQNFRSLLNWKPPAVKSGKKPATPAPVVQVPQVREVVQTYFASTRLPGADLHIQPPRGIMYCNHPVIAYTTNNTYAATLNLGGLEVPVHAQAVEYTYTWGDGKTLTTHSMGHPYPDYDVFHTYTCPERRSDPGWWVTISLTTSWRATFQDPTTGVWEEIPETLTTTETHPPRELGLLHTYLIDRDHQPK